MSARVPFQLSMTLTLLGLLTCTLMLPNGAYAQTAPTQSNPGLLVPSPANQPMEQRQEQEQKSLPQPQEASPQSDLNVPEPTGGVQLQTTTLQVTKVELEGNTLLTPQEVQPIIAQYEGKTVSLEELQQAVDQINALYRGKGYLTSQAFIPPQEVADGIVRIKVVEGTVGKVEVTGNKFYKNSVIARQLRIEEGRPFNIRQLEQDLRRSNQLNGNFRLKASLAPGAETGQTDVTIEVSERQPWQITPTFDNQGRPFIGYYRGGVEVGSDSLTGHGDRLFTKFLGNDQTRVFLGSYFLPINRWGDEIGISYGYSSVDVELRTPFPPDIQGTSHNVGLLYSHPFNRDRTWVGDIGFNFREVETEVNGFRDTRDGIRSLQAGLNYNKYDRLGRTFARLQSTLGADVLGGNTSFWKGELFMTRLFTLPMSNLLIIRAYGQVTPNDLPVAEQMQLGGAYSVRGYTEGLLLGDRGYNINIEDRFPLPFMRRAFPALGDRLQGAVFVDVGQTWLDRDGRNFVPGFSNTSQRTFLAGAGLGLRAYLTQYLQGFIDFGFGLVDREAVEPLGYPTARIHFGIRSDLLPTGYQSRSTEKTPLRNSKR